MIINNYRKTIIVKLRRFAIAVTIMVIIIIALMTELLNFFENSHIYISVILGSSYILYYLIEYFLNYNYIYYTDEGKKLIFRFYSMRMFQGVKKAIEIPKETFVRYEVKTSFFGTKSLLILYRVHQKEIIKYPPLNITLLKKGEKLNIYSSLNKFKKK